MRPRPHRVRISVKNEREKRPLRVIADAAVATVNVGDGRLIPLLIIDASERPDIQELVRVHAHVSPGDVECQWGQLEGSEGKVNLILSFKRPAEMIAILEFDITKEGGIVDIIVHARGLYIQPGRDGDRLSTTPDAPKILVEVPDTGFSQIWDDMFHRFIMKDLRRNGLSRQQAKQAASRFIEEWRRFSQVIRMRRS